MKPKILNLSQRPYSRGDSILVICRYDIPFSGDGINSRVA